MGVDLLASSVSAGGSVKIPVPFTNKNLVISGDGYIGGIGVQTYWSKEESRVKVGIAAVVGAGVSVGLEDKKQ